MFPKLYIQYSAITIHIGPTVVKCLPPLPFFNNTFDIVHRGTDYNYRRLNDMFGDRGDRGIIIVIPPYIVWLKHKSSHFNLHTNKRKQKIWTSNEVLRTS